MKTLTVHRVNAQYRPAPIYPNAATHQENVNKLMDRLLIGAISVAAVVVLMFLLTLA